MTFMVVSTSAVQPIDYEKLRRQSGLLPHVSATESVENVRGGSQESSGGFQRIPDAYRDQDEAAEHHQLVPLYIREIMSSPALALAPDATVREAWASLRTKRIHHLLVANEDERLLGIVSDRDLLRLHMSQSSRVSINSMPLKDVMRTSVLTALGITTIRAAAEALVSQRVGCLPVVYASGRLHGIVTRTDILRSVVMQSALDLRT